MHPLVKKVLIWLLIAFVIYAILTTPNRAADIVIAVWDVVATAFTNLLRFFDALLR